MDLISIIIPFFNAEKYIEATVTSVLEQSYSHFEILCIDDGSLDHTASIIKSIGDSRIKLYKKENTGVSDTRNYGFEKAKGEFVMYLDSDDLLCPTFLDDRISVLKNSQHIACCSDVILINEKGDKIEQKTLFSAFSSLHIFNYNVQSLTCPSGYLFNASLLLKNKINFNKNLQSSADKFLLLEVLAKEKIDFIESSPIYYRVLKNSMSHNISEQLIKDHISFYHEVKLKLDEKHEITSGYYSKLCYTIGASSFYINDYSSVVRYLVKSFVYSPKTLISLLIEKFI